jgi:magnesium-transporting ATPase (P-type)
MVFGAAATDVADPLGAAVIERASTGRRTLVLAFSPRPLTTADVEAESLPDELVAVAVLTFREKVRTDAAQTLEYFRAQGVGIRIISGDNPRTVAAIAREVGVDAAEATTPARSRTTTRRSLRCWRSTPSSVASRRIRRSAWCSPSSPAGTPSR